MNRLFNPVLAIRFQQSGFKWKTSFSYGVFSKAVILLFALFLSPSLWSQDGKLIEKEFSGKRFLSLEHRGGPISVKKSTDGKIHLKARLKVSAKNPEDAKKVYDQFDLKISSEGDKLAVKTLFDIKNSTNIAGSLSLSFNDGTKIRGLKNLSLSLEVETPSLETLKVNSKYDKIRVESDLGLQQGLTIQTYSGELEIGDLEGKLDLDAKYAKGIIGNFGNGALKLYECKLEMGDAKEVVVDSKYSKLSLGKLTSLEMKTYEDKVKTGDIQGDLLLADKYSDLIFGAFQNGRMDTYETEFSAPSAKDLQIKSKYTDWQIEKAGHVNFELSYEDKAQFGQISSLTTGNSKYANFKIGSLNQKLYLRSYEDDVDVEKVGTDFAGIDLDGKYVKLNAYLSSETLYRLEANMKYGKLTYPGSENEFESLYYKEKGNDLEIKGKRKGATDNSPLIKIAGYENKVVLMKE